MEKVVLMENKSDLDPFITPQVVQFHEGILLL